MSERESRPDPDAPTDPTGIDAPHDVLAADEFGIGTADERLPPDPHRFEPPHDILAAEEFAMPAGGEPSEGTPAGAPAGPPEGAPGSRSLTPLVLIGAAAALLVLLLRRRS